MGAAESGHPPSEGSGAGAGPDWERRRRLDEVFGDVLPDTTSDERDPGDTTRLPAKGPPDETRGDTWLRDQVPPHHGG